MWGIQWTFCHNGDVPLFKGVRSEKLPWLGVDGEEVQEERIYNPVGDTDSERMFCSILNALKAKFHTLPSLPVLHEYLRQLLQQIVDYDPDRTILNCLLGCGQYVQFAYSWPGKRPGSNVWNGLHYVVREPPFKRATLCDCDYEVDFSQLADNDSRVAVITTKPLTINEEWVEFEKGQLILFDAGLPHLLPEDSLDSELSGHGLCSDCHPSHPKTLEEDLRRFRNKKRLLTFTGDGI
jgi:glutamine amidotransferase